MERGLGDGRLIRVLVVDDSAVMRQFMSTLLTRERGMDVKVAADPLIALRKMRDWRPGVILLDLEMPRMDGLAFLRRIMAEDPIPVVVCSSHAGKGTEAALRALDEGAVEVLAKPYLGVRDYLEESATLLLDTIQAAAVARPLRRPTSTFPPRPTAEALVSQRPASRARAARGQIVAVGASTGGPEALRRLLEVLPVHVPGIVVVQHMPERFLSSFAERLDRVCRIEVKEAADSDQVTAGRALIAPGDSHTTVVRAGSAFKVRLTHGPPVRRHRPSVDVLFSSVAQAAGATGVGVIMTGMGDDGAAGLLEMRQAGATTLAQDEASCVVYGMPKAAIERGAVGAVVPLAGLPAALLSRVRGHSHFFDRAVIGSSARTRDPPKRAPADLLALRPEGD